jgi:anti-sigma factor RsiW
MSLPEVTEAELQAFVDGQLPAERCTAVLAYLGERPAELKRLADYVGHKHELRRRLETVDLPADNPTTAELERALAARLTRPYYSRWLRYAATVALLVAAGWISHGLYQNYVESRIPELVIKAAEAHDVFGTDQRRPVELTAASMAEMSDWFSSRLGRPVEIPVLATVGLRLIGGRLLTADDRPMAQLIYEDQAGRRLTLCLSSEPLELGEEVELVEVGDLTAGYWQDGDLIYALVGDRPDEQLVAIASELGAQQPGGRL